MNIADFFATHFAFITDPGGLGGADHADRDGGGARHRQPHLHLDPDQQAAAANTA